MWLVWSLIPLGVAVVVETCLLWRAHWHKDWWRLHYDEILANDRADRAEGGFVPRAFYPPRSHHNDH